MLVHDLTNVDIMGLDDVSNSFFKVSSLFFFLCLKLLEFGGIFKHFLRVLVSIVLKLFEMLVGEILDSLLKCVFSISLVFIKGVVPISMLQLR